MPCYYPVKAHKGPDGVKIGRGGYTDRPVDLPCGRCVGCRAKKAREWMLRCVHENQVHRDSCFVTLTYDDDHVPSTGSLEKSEFSLFLKRLRKKFTICCPQSNGTSWCGAPVGRSFRFFACGEYGEQSFRPHYHALFFGLSFNDLVPTQRKDLFRSQVLDSIWARGACYIGHVTPSSAGYVAGYVNKKQGGSWGGARLEGRVAPPAWTLGMDSEKIFVDDYADEGEYAQWRERSRVDLDTGEVYMVEPEFRLMSRRPGLGSAWFDRYRSDVFPHDEIVSGGREYPTPRFYDTLLEREDPEALAAIKAKRQEVVAKRSASRTDEAKWLRNGERQAIARLDAFTRRNQVDEASILSARRKSGSVPRSDFLSQRGRGGSDVRRGRKRP